jgi:hypothetical protein
MLVCQGCQTDAPNSVLFINSGGEIFRGDELVISSVNMRYIADKYGVDALGARGTAAGEAVQDAVQAEFAALEIELLSPREVCFARKVKRITKLTDFGRFRAYGQLDYAGGVFSECIVVCTEFCTLVEDAAYWELVEQVVRDTQAHYWVMDERAHLDRSCRVDDAGGIIPGSERIGPDHGKLERQIELSWRVENLSMAEIVTLLQSKADETQPIWESAGVGVC